MTLTITAPATYRRLVKTYISKLQDRDSTPLKHCTIDTLRGVGCRIHVPAWLQAEVPYVTSMLERRLQLHCGTTAITVESLSV
jgi:hypothetical protein